MVSVSFFEPNIDGESSNSESHFSKVYEKLYNSVDDREHLVEVKRYLAKNISEKNRKDVELKSLIGLSY